MHLFLVILTLLLLSASHPNQVGNRLTWADLAMFCLVEPEKKNNTEVLQQHSTNIVSHSQRKSLFSHSFVINFSSADDHPSLLGQLGGQGGWGHWLIIIQFVSFESILTDAIRYTCKTSGLSKVKHLSFKHLIRCQTLQTGLTLGQTTSCEHVSSTGQHPVNINTKSKKTNDTVVLTCEPNQESSYDEHIEKEQSRQQRHLNSLHYAMDQQFNKWTISDQICKYQQITSFPKRLIPPLTCAMFPIKCLLCQILEFYSINSSFRM